MPTNPNKTNIACRYFLHNMCNKTAEECDFSHEHTSPADMICTFYLAGHCNYGNKCRYDHIKPEVLKEDKVEKTQKIEYPAQPLPAQTSKMVQDMKNARRKDKVEVLWINANEFCPGQIWKTSKKEEPISYSDAVGKNLANDSGYLAEPDNIEKVAAFDQMCPYAVKSGACPFEEGACDYEHGDNCEFCLSACLSRTDPEQRKAHIDQCIKQHQDDMERAFQIEENIQAECGICFESVYDKEMEKDRRFGILSHCQHAFCLSCIRSWRKSNIESKRTCPKCRVCSDFVIPSVNVVNNDVEKEKLIQEYKQKLKQRPCMYFREGDGECPFNEHCFYKHTLADGTPVAARQRRQRRGHTDYDMNVAPPSYESGVRLDTLLRGVDLNADNRMERLFMESMDIFESV